MIAMAAIFQVSFSDGSALALGKRQTAHPGCTATTNLLREVAPACREESCTSPYASHLHIPATALHAQTLFLNGIAVDPAQFPNDPIAEIVRRSKDSPMLSVLRPPSSQGGELAHIDEACLAMDM